MTLKESSNKDCKRNLILISLKYNNHIIFLPIYQIFFAFKFSIYFKTVLIPKKLILFKKHFQVIINQKVRIIFFGFLDIYMIVLDYKEKIQSIFLEFYFRNF